MTQMQQDQIPQSVLDQAQKQFEILTKGAEQVTPLEALKEKLVYSIYYNKPLVVKLGLDPTSPDIHLGHTVVMHKLKQFQDLGHKVMFLVGDFTTKIGDPSGKSKTRPMLTDEQITENAKTYMDQANKILDPEKSEMVYNSQWLSKMDFAEGIKLLAKATANQMLQRENFANRFKNNSPIALHELVYPLLQGYDSVIMEADVEIGGTDQTFNCLMGRQIQKAYEQKQQIVMTMPLLEGLDGVEKMSKSLNNYVGITDEPKEMFGKIMSNNDDIMWKYYLFFSAKTPAEIEEMKAEVAAGKRHPMDVKKAISFQLVEQLHSTEDAEMAQKDFEQRFSKNVIPEDLEEKSVEISEPTRLAVVMNQIGFAASNSEANRLIKSGAVKINGEKVEDISYEVIPGFENFVLQAGKRRICKIK